MAFISRNHNLQVFVFSPSGCEPKAVPGMVLWMKLFLDGGGLDSFLFVCLKTAFCI